MKQLHDTTKKLSGKYSKPERPVKDKEGSQSPKSNNSVTDGWNTSRNS
ncbi:unnamed protein product [Schistosoma mattheei]|uniref:Uncharacterized protein n=1 Tax=Schistosoma mattheei TaxID=31246 RepID=A0A183Q2N5_9TREM|nr:unnamed protein product [Schistosoma mattheei]